MCGIFGLIEADSARSGLQTAMAATDALRHRGPDDWGLVALAPENSASALGREHLDRRIEILASRTPHTVMLGHRRLRVIDLSDAGRQPMRDPASTAWITYNGEVYNYRELRRELAASGAQFSTATDTEVVLQAYRKWGPQCVKKLRGMFAFGIWDSECGQLVLARDRVGKKPLFFHISDGRFAFASELKAFFALPEWQPLINPAAIHDYLTYGYVPGQQTIFQDVWKVPPGCFLVWSNGEVRIEPYWDVQRCFSTPEPHGTEDDVRDEVRQILADAVNMRLVSDVPVGAFLSGGLDSSAIVGLMARQLGSPLKTFSIGFRESSFNELEHARTVARHFRTDHHEYIVEPKATELLPDLVWHMDEPFADASALPTFLLARLAKEHVTVVLTGDGGDECFAGYDSYRLERWLDAYLRVPAVVRRVFEASLRNRRESGSRTAIWRRAKRFVEKGRLPFERREWRTIFSEAVKSSVYRAEFAAAVTGRDSLDRRAEAFHAWRHMDPVARLQLWDLTVYLPDDLMVKTDRTTMAHGLESRCPLLDHVLLERCARIPSSLKVRGTTTKYIFKRAVADLLPRSITSRPKQGFGVPISQWFRTELREMANDVLMSTESRNRGYFRPEAVSALLEAHESGRADHGHKLWALINLELWHRMYTRSAARRHSASLQMAAGQ